MISLFLKIASYVLGSKFKTKPRYYKFDYLKDSHNIPIDSDFKFS